MSKQPITHVALSEVAEVRFSSVDKHTVAGEKAVRLCNYTDVFKNRFIADSMNFMTASATDSEIVRFGLRHGDIAITKDSETPEEIGIPALVERPSPDLVLGYHLALIRAKAERCDPYFLAAALQSRHVARHYLRTAVGLTRFGLSIKAVADTPVPNIPLFTQRKIGRWYRESARLESHTDALIAAKREQKRGLMQQLLTGKVRFPGFTEPWKTVRLGELGLIKSGGTPATGESEYWGGPHAWCTPTDVTALQTRHLSRTSRTITDAGMRASAAELLPPKSVIVCTRATVGIAAINTVPMSMNQGFKAIVPRRDVDGDFLYYAISHAKTDLLRRAAGSTFIEVSMTSFKDIPIRWPSSFAEQRRIATLLAGVDLEIELLSSQRAAFAMQRRGLMEHLLSGDITIPSSDTSAA